MIHADFMLPIWRRKKLNSGSRGGVKFVDRFYSVVVHLFYFTSEHFFWGLLVVVLGCFFWKMVIDPYILKCYCKLTSSRQKNQFGALRFSYLSYRVVLYLILFFPSLLFKVYDAAVRWLKYDEPNRQPYMVDILAKVRFPLISKNFLSKTVQAEPLIQDNPECLKMVISKLTSS